MFTIFMNFLFVNSNNFLFSFEKMLWSPKVSKQQNIVLFLSKFSLTNVKECNFNSKDYFF